LLDNSQFIIKRTAGAEELMIALFNTKRGSMDERLSLLLIQVVVAAITGCDDRDKHSQQTKGLLSFSLSAVKI